MCRKQIENKIHRMFVSVFFSSLVSYVKSDSFLYIFLLLSTLFHLNILMYDFILIVIGESSIKNLYGIESAWKHTFTIRNTLFRHSQTSHEWKIEKKTHIKNLLMMFLKDFIDKILLCCVAPGINLQIDTSHREPIRK